MTVHMNNETRRAMQEIADRETKRRGIPIELEACVDLACRNFIEERRPQGREVTIRIGGDS